MLGALGGGRVDHQLAALSTLHAFPALHVTLLSERSSARLLQAGSHRLAQLRAGGGCSLVPLGARAPRRRRADADAHARAAAGPATVTTTGLQWDMRATPLAMGELACGRAAAAAALRSHLLRQVSTSNHVLGEEVTVHTDAPLLWTTESQD